MGQALNSTVEKAGVAKVPQASHLALKGSRVISLTK
jgi:hypothetical protein